MASDKPLPETIQDFVVARVYRSGSGDNNYEMCKSSAARSLQITITPPAYQHLDILQARCPFCHPTNSVKVLKAGNSVVHVFEYLSNLHERVAP